MQNAPGFLIDLLLILTAWFLRDPLLEISASFLYPAMLVAMLFQVAAFGASAVLMFAQDESNKAHWLQTAVYGACLLVVIFGPQWTHIPRDVLDMDSGQLPGSRFFGILFLGVYAAQILLWIKSAHHGQDLRERFGALLPLVGLPLIALYLLLTEAVILASLGRAAPAPDDAWIPIAILTASYLPTRLFLVFRPPFAWPEFLSALFAFYVFLSGGGLVPAVF